MDQTHLRELEDQCIQDCPPPCVSLCPAHVDVRALTTAICSGDFASGVRLLRKAVLFPEIIARTCDQPCQTDCYRKSVGGEIEIAALERSAIQYAALTPEKANILPKKDARVAVIGGGLSGMSVAVDLARKGYQVSLFDADTRLGGRLWQIPETRLPREVILRETQALVDLGVDLHISELVDARFVANHPFDAWYLDTGAHGLIPFDLTRDEQNRLLVDAQTFQTNETNIFSVRDALATSTVHCVSEGRRAAISIDRFLQRVSLTASRLNEGAYETRLVTNLAKVAPLPVLPPDPQSGYTRDEALQEAKRCLQCDCMECVKVCQYLKHYGAYPRKYMREIYNNLSIIMRARTANQMINSCTLCGLCGEVCPTDLNMAEVIHETRQTMVKTAKMPASAHDFALRDMAFSNSDRAALNLTRNGTTCTDLFFPGCQLSASNPEYIPMIYQSLSAVMPNLGVMLRCCGAPADWSGEQTLFNQTLEEFRRHWQALGRPRLVLACSSCHQIFKRALPEVQTISVWEVFEHHNLFPVERAYNHPLAIHDPCSSRHAETWQNAVRNGLQVMGIQFHELEMSRNLTECCGYGGVAWLANPALVSDILQRRISEDDADFLTYCVMCRDLLAQEGKPALHLLDLVYGTDPHALAQRKGPDYSQRHENRLRAKQKLVQLLSGKDKGMLESYEKYCLLIEPLIRKRLEERLLLIEDVQKVVEHAETSSEFFLNPSSGHKLACFKPNLITYWVEYSREEDAWRIHDAYSHRMELEGADRHE